MALRNIVRDIKLVSPEMRKHYEKEGDVWKLKVQEEEEERDEGGEEEQEEESSDDDAEDGDDGPKKKVGEFRRNNIKLKRKNERLEAEVKALREKVGGLDPDELESLREAAQRLEEIEEENLKKTGQIEKIVEKKTKAVKDASDKEIKKLQDQVRQREERINSLTAKYKDLKLETTAIQALSEVASVKPGALSDAIQRFKGVFNLDDNDELVTEEVDGEGEEFTPKTFAKHLVKEASHIFEPGSGGGAPGGPRKPGGSSNDDRGGKGVKVIKPVGNEPARVDAKTLDDIIAGKATVDTPMAVTGLEAGR